MHPQSQGVSVFTMLHKIRLQVPYLVKGGTSSDLGEIHDLALKVKNPDFFLDILHRMVYLNRGLSFHRDSYLVPDDKKTLLQRNTDNAAAKNMISLPF